MRILATAGDIDALIAEIRLRTPLTALAREQGWHVAWRSFHECRQADLAAADVLVVQRGASRRVLRLEERALQAGAAVIYEIDDLLTEIPRHISQQYEAVRAALPWIREGLGAADLVTASTPRLQRELAVLARATALVPNYAYFDEDHPLPAQRPGEPAHLLVASAGDLLLGGLTPALKRVVNGKARLVVVGPAASAFKAAGLPVQAYPVLPRAEFIALARRLSNVVGVIPLEASRFAACKSAVKWFDYAEVGVPTVASAVPPYLDVIESGRTGALVDNSEQQWARALDQAAGDAAWRRRIASEARIVVRERHGLAQTMKAWETALLQARHLRRARIVAPLTGFAAWRYSAADAAEDWSLSIRHWNRQRLARRHAVRLDNRG